MENKSEFFVKKKNNNNKKINGVYSLPSDGVHATDGKQFNVFSLIKHVFMIKKWLIFFLIVTFWFVDFIEKIS